MSRCLTYLCILLVVQRALEKVHALVVEVHIAERLEVHQHVDLAPESHFYSSILLS